MNPRQANHRIHLLLVIFGLFFAAVLARAVWVQVVQSSKLSSIAEAQHRHVIVTPASRGTIFDRVGVPLAIGEQMTTVFADPSEVLSPRVVAQAAQATFGVDAAQLLPELLNKKSQFVYIQRFADPKLAAAFVKRGYAGVSSYPEEKRTYPQLTVAPQVIGYAGVDDNGLEGLELQYNKQLSGHAGKQTVVTDPFGRALDVISSSPARQGEDVFSTIDHTIQANAELVARQTKAKWGARAVSVTVMDPKSGGVLAMAQAPGYNANDTNLVSQALQRNRPVTDTYEPGSTFKLVTITAALSTGLVKPTTTFTLPYRYQFAPCCTVEDADPRGTETMSVSQILSQSSNVGAVTIAQKLGGATLQQWIERFGFGEPTGIDFPGESAGDVLPYADWSGATIGNVPIGQGISVTPIQMASVYSAVANDGVWIQPHLVDRVGGGAPEHWKHRTLMSPTVDREIKAMLGLVVVQGTGVQAQIPGYTVAGKTGTAQTPNGHGGYSTTDFDATFVGMVPASNPKLVILVKVDDPHGNIYGGSVAAPAFADIAKFDLQYLNIPPDDARTELSASTG
jgi:cell division protein FtsI/penicillin-binding protein 2